MKSRPDELRIGRLERDLSATQIEVRRAEGQRVTLSFPASSESPVERFFGTEVLSHTEGAVDMVRIAGGAAPLLFNHDWNDPVGMIDSARLSDGRLHVEAHLFATARAAEVAAMVEGGLRNVSIGYQVDEMTEEVKAERYTATRWTPLEVSIVTVPADTTVGIGRSNEQDARPVRLVRTEPQPAAPAALQRSIAVSDQHQAAAGVNADSQQQRGLPAQARTGPSAMDIEGARVRAIENLCKANKIDDSLRQHWIGSGLSFEQVSEDILQILEKRGQSNPTSVAKTGLSESEAQRYSLLKAVRAVADKNWNDAGFELEQSRAIAKALGRMPDPNKFFVPFEVQNRPMPARRDLNAASGAAGGFLVETANTSFIELLRNRSVAYRMGARRLAGLMGNITVPRHTGAATAVWLASETSQITESDQTFGQMALSPKTVGAYTEISRQLLLQSSPDAESLVSADLATVAALAVDVGALRGSGASGQPTGIVNTPGNGSVTGTTLGYAGVLEFQTDVATANIIPAAGGYVTTPAVAAMMMQRSRFASTDTPLWSGNLWDGQMAGFQAMSTNQMTAATMLFGDWSQLVIGEWGVLEVEVNPYANFQAGIIGVRAMVTVDVGLRYAAAFSLASTIT
jgi:HK97 family phage major capsid protein/HK97 family phage prohead protease